MSEEVGRPDPDALLERVRTDVPGERGRLKVFFGAAPGVGKTYAMLEAARSQIAAGRRVLAGVVETHGREETSALRRGIQEIPRRAFDYRGTRLLELDLDAALRHRGAIVLVDELAHTNSPGARHARRHQDVAELLAAGIDVYTTLNVQHLDSLSDVVAQITGVTVRETVPDSVFEQADEVEVVDLAPDDLLRRLREGKVYLPERIAAAADNFFRKGNLIALRELALRATADRVDDQMEVWRRSEGTVRPWPVVERLVVSVSPSPSATRVVRAGRRLARRLRAEWLAVFVELPRHRTLPEHERRWAEQALRLAEELGAETATLAGTDPIAVLVDFARRRNATRIVVGSPGTYWRWRDLFLGGSFVGRLARRSEGIDVFVLHGDRTERVASAPRRAWPTVSDGVSAAVVVAACTLVSWPLRGLVDPSVFALVYIAGVTLLAARRGRGAAFAASLLSVAAFDVCFVPPYFTFVVHDPRFVVTFAVLLLVSLVVGGQAAALSSQATYSAERERRTHALYRLGRDLAALDAPGAMVDAIRRHVGEAFEGGVTLRLADRSGRLPEADAGEERERAVAQWVLDHGKAAGTGTDTLPSSRELHVPLAGAERTLGVLSLRRTGSAPLRADQRHLLETFAGHAATALERALLAADAREAKLAVEGERLRNAVLSTLSHDLRTPLSTIEGAASALVRPGEPLSEEVRRELVETIREDSSRMVRLVGDLLDIGRIQTGGKALRNEEQPLEEAVGAALRSVGAPLEGRPVRVALPPDLPAVVADAALVERVLANLVENAARYTPPGTPVDIVARARGARRVEVEVLDRGPGIPESDRAHLFDRYFRGESAGARPGSGLGLALCRAIVEAHGGTLAYSPRDGGGAVFRFDLPAAAAEPAAPPGAEAAP